MKGKGDAEHVIKIMEHSIGELTSEIVNIDEMILIIVLEALSKDFRSDVPWELIFTDDLVIVATFLEKLIERG